MILTIERAILLSALARVSGVIGKRSTIATLNHVLIDCADDGRTVFRGTNLDMEATATVRADVIKAGAVLVDAGRLNEIAKNAAEGSELRLEMKDRLAVTSGRSRFNLATLPTDQFPTFSKLTDPAELVMSSDLMKSLVGRASFAASVEATRAYICGVYLFSDGAHVGGVATDGKRLALTEIEAAEPEFGVTVPSGMVAEMVRALDVPGIATLRVTSSKVQLRGDGYEITSKIIDGTYPAFRTLVPSNFKHSATADREALALAIRRASIASDDGAPSARFTFTAGAIRVIARGQGGDAFDEIEAGYSGPDVEMGMNCRFALEALAAHTSRTVVIDFNDKVSPVVIRDPNDAAFLALVMPLRV